MREIKFRAWDKYNKQWVGFEMTRWALYDEKNEKQQVILCTPPKEEIVFMQYTGLKDKNGKEIYEGDIVNHLIAGKNIVRKVEWIKNGYWSIGDFYGGEGHEYTAEDRIEVIGNIYETQKDTH